LPGASRHWGVGRNSSCGEGWVSERGGLWSEGGRVRREGKVEAAADAGCMSAGRAWIDREGGRCFEARLPGAAVPG